MLRNTSCEQLDLFQQIEYHRIPKNHILLRIDSEISLSFVNELLADKLLSFLNGKNTRILQPQRKI